MSRMSPARKRARGVLWAALAVVFVSAAVVAAKAGTQDSRLDVLERAGALELRGEYAAAETALRTALTRSDTTSFDGKARSVQIGARRAWMLILLSKYRTADSLLVRLLPLAEAVSGRDSVECLTVLNLLGRSQFALGHYPDAESFYLRAMAIARKCGGEESPAIAPALQGMAEVYQKLRRFGAAELVAAKAHRIFSADGSTPPLDMARATSTLARIRRGYGAYDEAERLYNEALSVATSAGGPDHPAVGVIENQLAALGVNLRHLPEAERHAQAARSIIRRRLGTNHIEYGDACFHLANVRGLEGRLAEAKPLYRKALSVTKSCLGPSHHDVAAIYEYMGFSYRLAGRYEDAIRYANRALHMRRQDYVDNGGHLADYESILYAETVYYGVSDLIAYYFDSPKKTAAQTRLVADAILTCKGMALDGVLLQQSALRDCTQPAARDLSRRLQEIRAFGSKLYFRNTLQFRTISPDVSPQIDSLREAEEGVLVAISRYTRATRQSGLAQDVTTREIRASLPAGTCLVDYFRYLYVTPSAIYSESSRYGVIVIDRSGVVELKSLTRVEDIDVLTREYRTLREQRASAALGELRTWLARWNNAMTGLRTFVWDPVASAVASDKNVLISTDVGLYDVPFASFKDQAGRYLIEDHVIHYVDSGRDLLRRPGTREPTRALFALGDPDYDASVELRQSSVAGLLSDPGERGVAYALRSVPSACEEFASLKVSQLPGTRREIARVTDAWKRHCGDSMVIFEGPAACEEAVKQVAPGHRIVHLATHGFFISGECGSYAGVEGGPHLSRIREGPLLRSGVLLAGANLKSETAQKSGAEDGILTAEEVSSLNFTGTDMVVLSACETGLSESGGSSLGLRRAFEVAGARTVVSSLWPISDQVTIELMERLYSNLERPPAETLHDFAIDKIREARAHGEETDPFLWAPFTASGAFKTR